MKKELFAGVLLLVLIGLCAWNLRYLSRMCTQLDEAVAQAARRGIARMNDRVGEEKYFYLHRGRELLKADEKWMGRDRKRGALMALVNGNMEGWGSGAWREA